MKEDEYKKSCIEMNNEEISYKMSIPMFEDGELERFDNNIHSIIEEYSKMQLHEKDQILTQRIIMKQEEEIHKKEAMYDSLAVDYRLSQEEIERLNNIINELEKWLDEEYQYYDKYGSAPTGCAMGQINRTKDKLQELKGSDKE